MRGLRRYLGWLLVFATLFGSLDAVAGHHKRQGHGRAKRVSTINMSPPSDLFGSGAITGVGAATAIIFATGQLIGAPQGAGSQTGVIGWTYTSLVSFDTDATNEYVDCGDNAAWDSLTRMTILVWTRGPTAGSTGATIVAKQDSNQFHHRVNIAASNAFQVFIGTSLTANANFASAGSVHTNNTWQQLIIVYDGTQGTANNRLILYVDGASVASGGTYTGTMPTALTSGSTSLWQIAAHQASGSATSFVIQKQTDEVVYWFGTAADSSQASTLWNSGATMRYDNTALGTPNIWIRGDGDSDSSVTNRGSTTLTCTTHNLEAGDLSTSLHAP